MSSLRALAIIARFIIKLDSMEKLIIFAEFYCCLIRTVWKKKSPFAFKDEIQQ